MRELTRLMSEDFESVFASSEDVKKLMQGVYNTFTEKFGFQKMAIPALDLENHRIKLRLLVHDTEAFCRDPINVGTYKSFLVKKFYGSLVAQARTIFLDAKGQSERWVQAVTMPLEAQIRDHKVQLQARLDNLSKINEKSTGINEKLAELKAVAADLQKQREMIEGLLQRVSQQEAQATTATHPERPRKPLGEQSIPAELMQTTRLSTFDAPLTINRRAARAHEVFAEVSHVTQAAPKAPEAAKPSAPPKPAVAPMISDDIFGEIGKAAAQPAVAVPQAAAPQPPAAEPRLEEQTPLVERTLRLPGDGERTQILPAFNPRLFNPDGSRKAFNPDTTQQLYPPDQTPPAEATRTQKLEPQGAAAGSEATKTQRLNDSISKLQEAKRLLQGDPQKS
jgi:hypothetical protein